MYIRGAILPCFDPFLDSPSPPAKLNTTQGYYFYPHPHPGMMHPHDGPMHPQQHYM